MEGRIHIGTSGWSYKHWKHGFYPARVPASQWLSWYSKFFDTTEINNSFYRLPRQETVIEWMKKVPDGFLFCAKMNRFLTHLKRLLDPEDALERFFEVFEPMKKSMGPVLIQLPASFKFDYDRTEHFYRALNQYKGYSFVMEVRHDSWMKDDSLILMSKHDIGLVISQSGMNWPYTELVTANNIYVRFHGPGKLYASSYSDDMLKSFAAKFRKWAKEGHEVWAYFNNDFHGHAVVDAQKLRAMLD